MFKSNVKKILILFFFLLFAFEVSSLETKNIKINGNKRISNDTILSYINLTEKLDEQDLILLNRIQKDLFSTGFFSNVKIKYEEKNIVIDLIENPFIKFFYVDGVSEAELNDLEKFFFHKENSFFSEGNLKRDSNLILEYFKNRGFYDVVLKIDYTKIDDNSLNLIYNINKNKVSKIKNIQFIGNEFFSNSELSSVIESSVDGWWKFLSSTTKVNTDILNYDVNQLKNFYVDRGFYDFQILASYYEKKAEFSVSLIFSLYEGTKYDFGSFEIEKSKSFLPKNIEENIYKIAKTTLYSSYSTKKIEKLKKKIDDILFYNNFLDINYNISEEKKQNKINLKLLLFKTDKFYQIKNILVVGNDLTNESVIRRNIFFNEGDIFNEKNYTKSLLKLKNLDIFKNVSFEKEIEDTFVNLKISVTEKPTGEISAGAGAGTNGAVINAGIQEKNFLGNGNKLASYLNLGTDKIEGNINYTNNDFNKSGKSLTTAVFATKYDFTESSGYKNSIYGTRINSKYEALEDIFFSPGASIEFDTFKAEQNASSLIKKREGEYLSSKIFYTISNDKRNSTINPTDGYEIGFGQTLSALISDIPSIQNTIFGSFHQELFPKFNGSIKYRLRSINSLNDKDIMFSERLHLSDLSLRGFKSRGVGPRDGSDHVGGNYSVNSTISSTIPNFIPETWNTSTGIFLDMANLWGVDYSKTIDDSNSIRMSIGLGLNWLSPLGPISLTYASPIMKESTDKIREFSFNLGTVF